MNIAFFDDWKTSIIEAASGNKRLREIEEKTAAKQKELKKYHENNGESMKRLAKLTQELIHKNKEVKEEKMKYKKLFLKIAKIAEEVFEQRIEDMELSESDCEECMRALDKYKGFCDKVLQIVKTEMDQCQTETDGTNTQSTS